MTISCRSTSAGSTRLLGPARTIGEEMRREAAARGVRVHVAVAGTRTAALLLALARPGLTVVAPWRRSRSARAAADRYPGEDRRRAHERRSSQGTPGIRHKTLRLAAVSAFKRWGLKTLGELAALPSADLSSRLGRPALVWQAMARGEDIRPLVPMLEDERFESSLELEWPIEGLEPLSFVLTRLLEPLSTRLERRDRGAAVLHVLLRLVTRRDLRAPAASCRRRCATCGRCGRWRCSISNRIRRRRRSIASRSSSIRRRAACVQHTLFTRAQPTPEQLSTLLARLGALMGQDRFGAPATVDSRSARRVRDAAVCHRARRHEETAEIAQQKTFQRQRFLRSQRQLCEPSAVEPQPSCLRCAAAASRSRRACAVADGRPVRVTTDRRGFAGGAVTHCAGPWRTSGDWWAGGVGSGSQQVRRSQCQSTLDSGAERRPGIATSGTSRSATARSTASFAIATPTAGSSTPFVTESANSITQLPSYSINSRSDGDRRSDMWPYDRSATRVTSAHSRELARRTRITAGYRS